MSKPSPFTQAQVRRTIAAARAAGLRVTAVKIDGTVIVDDRGVQAGLVPSDIESATSAADDELQALI